MTWPTKWIQAQSVRKRRRLVTIKKNILRNNENVGQNIEGGATNINYSLFVCLFVYDGTQNTPRSLTRVTTSSRTGLATRLIPQI